jgi:hypothetical protein
MNVSNLLNEVFNIDYDGDITFQGTINNINKTQFSKIADISTNDTNVSNYVSITSNIIISSVNSKGYLTANTIPTASTAVLGGVKVDGTTITINGSGVISGANTYILPTATTSVLGGVKVDGTTITINGSGVISGAPTLTAGTNINIIDGAINSVIPIATTTVLGGVKVDGTTITINGSGVISGTPAYSLPTSTTTVLGGVKVDGTTITINGSGVISGTPAYSLPTSTTTVLGGVKVDGTTITINGSGVISGTPAYSLPTSTTTVLGGVKVDGTTITINGSGVISGTPAYSLPTSTTTVLGGVKVDGTTITINGSGVISGAPTLTAGTNINIIDGAINSVIPIATTTVLGAVKVDGTTITINGSGVISGTPAYSLPTSTTTVLGGVKVDGTTITINGSGVISGTPTYSLPTSTTTVLGGVKVDGTTITINGSGVISGTPAYSLPTSTTTVLGGVKVDGTTITINGSGVISGTPAYSLPTSTTTVLGGVKVDGTTITIDGSGVISTATGSSQWTTSGANIHYNSGNVGIGTTNPTFSLLHLHKISTLQDVRVQFTDGTSTGVSNRGLAIGKGTDNRSFVYNYENTGLFFGTNAIERMTISNTGDVGIGTNTLIESKLTINPIVNDRNAFNHSEAPLTITQPTATSTSVLNDPKSVLHLCRQGTGGQAFGARATFKLCRYENATTNSRTRLDLLLSHTNYDETASVSFKSDGNVGIGTTNPLYKLDVAGTCKVTNELYVGNAGGGGIIYMGGGAAGDGVYDHSVIETRNYASTENTEMLLFKGNDLGTPSTADRIRLRAGAIVFDTFPGASVDRAAENIRMVIDGSGNVGIGINPAADRLHVSGGNILSTGDVIAYYSDERLKNIKSYIKDVLPTLDEINVFKYNSNDLGESFGYDKDKDEIGLSAQEIQKYFPELINLAPFDTICDSTTNKKISKSGENYLTLNYTRLVPILLQLIKELNNKNKNIDNELRELKEKYTNMNEKYTNMNEKYTNINEKYTNMEEELRKIKTLILNR